MNLIEAAEEKFGVEATAAVAVAAGPAGGEAEAAEEKTEFDVVLSFIRWITKLLLSKQYVVQLVLALKKLKKLLNLLLKQSKKAVSKEEAEELKKTLEEAGAEVELK